MKATKLTIHHFRSFAEAEVFLNPYTLVVGTNNAGKTNLIDAIRLFYSKDIKLIMRSSETSLSLRLVIPSLG
ncbi:AAA family ATPase [Thermosynechococcus sp. HN-54]|uniref:AAA family ATPase n=1 Tax=Thermosynechococcus sp. HN-54 TaxID=2933959 RepID=UPI0037DD683F